MRGTFTRLSRSLNQELRFHRQTIAGLDRRLTDPATQIAQRMVQVDEMDGRLQRAWRSQAERRRSRIRSSRRALSLLAPARQIGEQVRALAGLNARLRERLARDLSEFRLALGSNARALSAVSPLNTLNRGYAVLTRDDAGDAVRTITSVADVAAGENIRGLLADGSLKLAVTGVDPEPPLAAPVLEGDA